MSPRTAVRMAVFIVWRATFSGTVLCVPQSDSDVVVDVLTPLVVVATLVMLLLELLRSGGSSPSQATARGTPTAVNPRLLVAVLVVGMPGGVVHLMLVVHPQEHLIYTPVV